ncbi:unnamed protein product [Rangifer tarandus platyrhynchus]|uniref:Uncharacterized protein n=1 Tax=Rangifer tarandus platyrhynchus TaxID=3082113 RepID=A0ABN8Y3D1_RANTA|nr:unnamed protein product [Rangifer tarandus platyrhynchus]
MLSRGGGVRRPSGNAELQLPSLRRTLLTAPSLYGLARESKGIGCLWLRWPPWRRRSRGHGAGSGYRRRCSAQPRGGDPSDPVPAFAQAREEPPERGRRELSVPTVGVGSGARDRGGKRTLFHSRTSLLGQTCPRGTSQGARRSFPPVVQNPRSGWAGTAGLCNWGFEVLRPLLEERGGGSSCPAAGVAEAQEDIHAFIRLLLCVHGRKGQITSEQGLIFQGAGSSSRESGNAVRRERSAAPCSFVRVPAFSATSWAQGGRRESRRLRCQPWPLDSATVRRRAGAGPGPAFSFRPPRRGAARGMTGPSTPWRLGGRLLPSTGSAGSPSTSRVSVAGANPARPLCGALRKWLRNPGDLRPTVSGGRGAGCRGYRPRDRVGRAGMADPEASQPGPAGPAPCRALPSGEDGGGRGEGEGRAARAVGWRGRRAPACWAGSTPRGRARSTRCGRVPGAGSWSEQIEVRQQDAAR